MTSAEAYPQLEAHVFQFLRAQSVDSRIRAMVLDLVNQALRARSIQISNAEKDALTHEVMRDILLEMLKEYQNGFPPN